MSTENDRNLLIGVMALQMDFVTRDQLVEAMNAWMVDKSKPLDKILVVQDALAEDTRNLLVSVVDKHVELHRGDAQTSLEVLSRRDSSFLEELSSISDDTIRVPLESVFREQATEAEQTTPFAGETMSDSSRFRILRPHASGGLGKISIALDKELNREVALKEIQERHANDDNSRARFLLEAEITGGLEHPGIVPVYGLGTYTDGQPYYAMRFVRGNSLGDAIKHFHEQKEQYGDAKNSLELRKLLGRFIDVCQAVEYAHSRGVLHRDLKPGNVMLGKYGETLVVDWGLAKSMGRGKTAKADGETTLVPSSGSGTTPTQYGRKLSRSSQPVPTHSGN